MREVLMVEGKVEEWLEEEEEVEVEYEEVRLGWLGPELQTDQGTEHLKDSVKLQVQSVQQALRVRWRPQDVQPGQGETPGLCHRQEHESSSAPCLGRSSQPAKTSSPTWHQKPHKSKGHAMLRQSHLDYQLGKQKTVSTH